MRSYDLTKTINLQKYSYVIYFKQQINKYYYCLKPISAYIFYT